MFFICFRWLFVILCRQREAACVVWRRGVEWRAIKHLRLGCQHCCLSLLSLISSSLILPLSSPTSRCCCCCCCCCDCDDDDDDDSGREVRKVMIARLV